MPSATSPVLGLVWNREADTLALADAVIRKESPADITKRTILSATQSLFDPLGMICPVLICPKVLLQKLWCKEINWDTRVNEDTEKAFSHWLDQLSWLKQLEIPRWAFGGGPEKPSISLHAFVDASQEAYASVIYAIVELGDKVECYFVVAKSRVSPKDKPTIPRLELLAATVGARLMASVLSALNYTQVRQYFWTESSTVFAWIQRDKEWGTFVGNRVQEIRTLTNPASWSHIPGSLNPADLPSRGYTARLPPALWPKSSVDMDEADVEKEVKKTTNKKKTSDKSVVACTTVCHVLSNVQCQLPNSEVPWYMPKFSRYTQLVRRVAWIQRFLANCRQNPDQRIRGALSLQEVEQGELTLLRLVQEESFSGVNDPRFTGLTIYKDTAGLKPDTVEKIVEGICILHNVILDLEIQDGIIAEPVQEDARNLRNDGDEVTAANERERGEEMNSILTLLTTLNEPTEETQNDWKFLGFVLLDAEESE
ncbi:uncharacterized protein LOC107046821 [Diachasma alloeum]|uniref:uncharacterized protein LOC107046821 n=1 Tax=Diachasma alloeum TaxID=454923 RepID=UPI0007382C0B|nr:uncharacterized protein LOC107046821 [Diachasma alloeum]